MGQISESLAGLVLELRRGTIIIAVLSQLADPKYGYSLVSILKEKGLQVEPNTLYPLLRRLEKQNLLNSVWDTGETRPRKYYVLSEKGHTVFERLCQEWHNMSGSLNKLLDEHQAKNSKT